MDVRDLLHAPHHTGGGPPAHVPQAYVPHTCAAIGGHPARSSSPPSPLPPAPPAAHAIPCFFPLSLLFLPLSFRIFLSIHFPPVSNLSTRAFPLPPAPVPHDRQARHRLDHLSGRLRARLRQLDPHQHLPVGPLPTLHQGEAPRSARAAACLPAFPCRSCCHRHHPGVHPAPHTTNFPASSGPQPGT